MKLLNLVTILTLKVSALIVFVTPVEAATIPIGIYANETDSRGACTVTVQRHSRIWGTASLTVTRKSLHPEIIPDQTVTSDPIVLREIESQSKRNQGRFLIVTKKSSNRTRRVSGSLLMQDGSLFLNISVFKEACFGFCQMSAVDCLVRIQEGEK